MRSGDGGREIGLDDVLLRLGLANEARAGMQRMKILKDQGCNA